MNQSNSQSDKNAAHSDGADASTRRRLADSDRPTRRGRKLIVLALALLVGAGMIEFGFRWLGPQPVRPRRIEPGVPFDVKPGGRLAYLPNTRFASVYDPSADSRSYFGESGRVEYVINAFGFRGPAPTLAKRQGIARIACLGDSFTFGEGVRYEDTWPVVLGRQLDETPLDGWAGAESLNAGIQGSGLLDCLMMYGERIEQFAPDVVVLGFFMNDLMPSRETIRINDQLNREAPATGIARYSAVAAYVEQRRRAARLQASLFQSIRESFGEEGLDTLNQALVGFEAYSNERGFRLLVVVFPVLWNLDGDYPLIEQHNIVADACKQAGVEHMDLLGIFKADRAESLWVHPTDQHPNELAHRRAGKAIADRLRKP